MNERNVLAQRKVVRVNLRWIKSIGTHSRNYEGEILILSKVLNPVHYHIDSRLDPYLVVVFDSGV